MAEVQVLQLAIESLQRAQVDPDTKYFSTQVSQKLAEVQESQSVPPVSQDLPILWVMESSA